MDQHENESTTAPVDRLVRPLSRGRQDLRPWAQRLPKPILIILAIVLGPLFVAIGAWDGIKSAVADWIHEVQKMRRIND